MIEPNMATMLAYLLTDLNLPSEKLQQILKKCVEKTFNALSIDGNDYVFKFFYDVYNDE